MDFFSRLQGPADPHQSTASDDLELGASMTIAVSCKAIKVVLARG
jgi:hypothetical protein